MGLNSCGPVLEHQIRKHDCRHRLNHGHDSWAQAHIVAAFDYEVTVSVNACFINADCFLALENARHGLYCHPEENVVSVGDSAQNAARIVRFKYRLSVRADTHFVVVCASC